MDRKEVEREAVEGLLARMREYDAYFKSSDEVTSRDYTAYASLVRTLMQSMKLSVPDGGDPDELRKQAREILVSEYGVTMAEDGL